MGVGALTAFLLDRTPGGVSAWLPPRGKATANLDQAGEAGVEAAIQRLLHVRTAVIIAHRLATALRADRVVVVEDGRIVQDGAPAELLAVDGPLRHPARRLARPER